MDLKEKQEKFEYRSPKDLVVWGEPFSPDEWNEKLLKIGGRDPLGDARLRIVWGGTATKRGYSQEPTESVECDIVKYPGPIPHVQNIKGYNFVSLETGKVVFVVRPDHIPKGRIATPVIEVIHLGKLRWVLERKFTPEELIAMEMYPDPDSIAGKAYGYRGGRRYAVPMNPRGEYIGLYPLQTPDGRYWEPDELWFELLAKTEKDARELSQGDRMIELDRAMDDIEKRERQAAEAKLEEQDSIFEESVIEVEKAPRGVVIFDQNSKAAKV